MEGYEDSLKGYKEEEIEELRSFLEEKDFEWSEVIRGEEKLISQTTLENILDDIRNDRGKRKSWFRIKSAIAMSNYEENDKWSNLEVLMKEILESLSLELNEDFYHNFKLHNEEGTGYFALDFILPDFRKVIEVDGSVWHENLDNVEEKDERRDQWLKRLGYDTIRFNNEELQYQDQVKEKIERNLL